MADHTLDPIRHDGEHDGSEEDAAHPGISLRCRGCRFLIVVSSMAQVRGLGWVRIDIADGSGLCRACRADNGMDA